VLFYYIPPLICGQLKKRNGITNILILEKSNRDLQEFAYVASHDLQEPLRKIESFGNFLINKGDSLVANPLSLVTFFIDDNGIGFDESQVERIFQPFQRLVGRSEYEGSGMGLAICRKIIERHGGSITAKSTPRIGSTFIVTLPGKPGSA
jgi:light-regulated signal transduction histidine kinase (bacteriophytochrome)